MTTNLSHQVLAYGLVLDPRCTYIGILQSFPPKGEHSYLLPNLLGRVSMFLETYRIDGLQTEASLKNLNIVGCTCLLDIERLHTPPNPKIAGY